ncbi:hypothetical protein, partial [Thiolapillus sp.]|uniref:hypothetical protein n=1 Tax=Thiolapillus sp. TaxID=2017437 RepID=UPI003AF8AD0E
MKYRLRPHPRMPQIYLYRDPVDFRKSFRGLAEEKFHWPGGEEELVSLTGQQINWLLDGYNLGAMKGHR